MKNLETTFSMCGIQIICSAEVECILMLTVGLIMVFVVF